MTPQETIRKILDLAVVDGRIEDAVAVLNEYAAEKELMARIDENKSVFEMLKIHGNARCMFSVRERIQNLYLKLNNKL